MHRVDCLERSCGAEADDRSPDGISIACLRVPATETIRIGFLDINGSPEVLNESFIAIVHRSIT